MKTFLRLACFHAAIVTAAFAVTEPAAAEVRLPAIFGDHMVLQRQMPIRVWGWAEPGSQVTVTIGDQTQASTPNASGRFDVAFTAMEASDKPMELTATQGDDSVTIRDILVGEVWLCSGQSNMEWTVRSSSNAKQEIAAANDPLIRHIKVPKKSDMRPLDDFQGAWQVSAPETVGDFTACGYFMARELRKELGVPIGLVNSSWGGTRVEPWTPPVGFASVDALAEIEASVMGRTPGTDAFEKTLREYLTQLKSWTSAAESSLADGDSLSPAPAYPDSLRTFISHQDPTMLYNAMIHPVLGYSIRGAIWYQGESNHNEGKLYTEKKKALIGGWRELWDQGDFPFYFVQIAPFQYGNEDGSILAEFWEAQAAVTEIPNTGMVVTNDIATLDDIHPPNKQDVGKRLALLALRNDYGREDVVAESPTLESMVVGDDHLKLTFTGTGGGLRTRDGKPPTHFQIIGSGSGGFQAAVATIDGDTVTLRSDQVSKPVAFRFAWDKLAEPNLMGGTGLPVGAVRGGTLPQFADTLPLGDDFELVYDLDLSKLGPAITYDVDRSDSVGEFDRVAYLVELTQGDQPARSVFVVLDAFTDDAKQVGIPTVSSGARFQQAVTSMDVYSNVPEIETGTNITTGNIEFWPNNYGPQNTDNISGASGSVYDFGDSFGPPVDGYGSMQVHHGGAKQTIFAINQWKSGANADLGIGNSEGRTRDWTFTSSASQYSAKRLRVYVDKAD